MNGRFTFVGCVMLVALVATGAYAVASLPDVIPTSFSFDGKAQAMGSKWTLLLLPALGTVAFALLAFMKASTVRLPFAIPDDRADAVTAIVERGIAELAPAFVGGFFAVEFTVFLSARDLTLSPVFIPAIILCVAAILLPIGMMYARVWRAVRA